MNDAERDQIGAQYLRAAAADLVTVLHAHAFDHGAEPYGGTISRPVDAVTVSALLERAKALDPRPRGVASKHARERMRQRYGITLTPEQWCAMGESIAHAIDRGEAFEEETAAAEGWRNGGRARRWNTPIVIEREGGDLVVPIGFSYDGHQVTILTVLPGGGRCR